MLFKDEVKNGVKSGCMLPIPAAAASSADSVGSIR